MPPCVRLVVFEGRRAIFHDRACGDRPYEDGRFCVTEGEIAGWSIGITHPELGPFPHIRASQGWHPPDTDDLDEAESLWAEACERLRAKP